MRHRVVGARLPRGRRQGRWPRVGDAIDRRSGALLSTAKAPTATSLLGRRIAPKVWATSSRLIARSGGGRLAAR